MCGVEGAAQKASQRRSVSLNLQNKQHFVSVYEGLTELELVKKLGVCVKVVKRVCAQTR